MMPSLGESALSQWQFAEGRCEVEALGSRTAATKHWSRMEAAEDIFRVGGIRPHESFGEDTYLQYLQHKYQHMNTFHKVIIPLNKIYIKLSGIV